MYNEHGLTKQKGRVFEVFEYLNLITMVNLRLCVIYERGEFEQHPQTSKEGSKIDP